MNRWTSAVALAVAGAMMAGPALAQTSTPAGGAKDKTEDSKGSSRAPAAAGETKSGAGATGTTGAAGGAADTKAAGGAKAAGKNGQMGAGGEQVRAVQEALKEKGQDPGPVDGVMGPRTQSALREFQKQEGLQPTGRLNQETMAKLGVEGKAGANASTPAASPKTEESKPGAASGTGGASKPGAAPSSPSGAGPEGAKKDEKKQ